VGTWNGGRALEMNQYAVYYGFDLFEDATSQTDTAEFNVKPHFSVEDVGQKLKAFGKHDFYLFKGNTRETLTKFANEFTGKIDFFWIDGGHSVQTIRMDWENVKKLARRDSVILFDDYYSGMSDEKLKEIGCNSILDELDFDLLPDKDWVKGGGLVQMARVFI
jgi:hypothetical protein